MHLCYSWYFHLLIYYNYRKLALLEVAREDEFSPLKNARGSPKESPETALGDLSNLHFRYLTKAGAKFIDINGATSLVCEISPLLSYAGEGLEDKVKGKEFSAASEIYLPADGEDKTEEPAAKKSREC